MSFDLAELDTISACDKGFELELIHPKLKTPMGWFVNILGSDSTEFRNFTRARGNENIRKILLKNVAKTLKLAPLKKLKQRISNC